MSRYLERAEHTARVLEVHLTLMLDQFPESAPLRWHRLLGTLCLDDEPEATEFDATAITRMLSLAADKPFSIYSCLGMARENARQIRDNISSEMFEQLNRLYHTVRNTTWESIEKEGLSDFTLRIVEGSASFAGVTASTISHAEGYQFIQIGKHLERALMTIAQLNAYREFYHDYDGGEDGSSPTGHLDLVALLKCSTAFEAYCRTHTATLRKTKILEFLLLDADFPHSVRFSVERLHEALSSVGRNGTRRDTGPTDRLIGRLHSQLAHTCIDEVMESGVDAYLESAKRQLESLHNTMHDVFINYPIEKELSA
jgi:uncharacterized alpha-E superfamily protein